MKTEDANELLPQEPTKAIKDPAKLKYLMIGPPKWGKTTFMCSAPDTLLLATEEGHAFHELHKIVVDHWDLSRSERGRREDDDGNVHLSMAEAVEAIVASDRFKFVVIDTADMAAKMCLDYHYKKYGVSHASDAGEYGKGWDLTLTQPFRREIGAIMRSGRGVAFITHSDVRTKKVGNVEVSREETTLPSQVQKFLHTQADVILHGKFGRLRKGHTERDRIIVLDGTNEILAGARVRGIRMPKKFIVSPDHPWEQWASFFEDEKNCLAAEREFLDAMGVRQETIAEDPETNTLSEPAQPSEPKPAAAAETTTPPAKNASRSRRS